MCLPIKVGGDPPTEVSTFGNLRGCRETGPVRASGVRSPEQLVNLDLGGLRDDLCDQQDGSRYDAVILREGNDIFQPLESVFPVSSVKRLKHRPVATQHDVPIPPPVDAAETQVGMEAPLARLLLIVAGEHMDADLVVISLRHSRRARH